MDERGGEVQPSLHATRVGADPALGGLRQPDPAQQISGALAPLDAIEAMEGRLQPDQLLAGHQRIERGLLQCDADRRSDVGALGDDVVTRDPRATTGRAQQRGQHPDGGRLAGAVGTEERVDLSLGDFDVDPGHGQDLVGECPLQVDCLDGEHGRPFYVRTGRIRFQPPRLR